MSRVFVVQKQLRMEQGSGELVPKFDLSSAERFGPLIYLLSPTAGPFNPVSIIRELRTKLADFTPSDHLLLVGNPCIIGWAVAVAAQVTGGEVCLLQWSGKEKSYLSIKSKV